LHPWNKATSSLICFGEGQLHFINRAGDTKMLTTTRFALAAALILNAASAVLADNIETRSSEAQSSIGCPALEGYPDCHPDDRAPSSTYSTHSRRPVSDRSRR
jgi:hypothetical protein